jgi:hypothetical protein
MTLEHVFLDHLIPNQMFLDDPFNHLRRGRPIPDALRVDQDDRPFHADPQAVGLGPEDAGGAFGAGLIESQFAQTIFEIFPGGESRFLATADRFALIRTDKQVTIDHIDAEFLRSGGQDGVGVGRGIGRGLGHRANRQGKIGDAGCGGNGNSFLTLLQVFTER